MGIFDIDNKAKMPEGDTTSSQVVSSRAKRYFSIYEGGDQEDFVKVKIPGGGTQMVGAASSKIYDEVPASGAIEYSEVDPIFAATSVLGMVNVGRALVPSIMEELTMGGSSVVKSGVKAGKFALKQRNQNIADLIDLKPGMKSEIKTIERSKLIVSNPKKYGYDIPGAEKSLDEYRDFVNDLHDMLYSKKYHEFRIVNDEVMDDIKKYYDAIIDAGMASDYHKAAKLSREFQNNILEKGGANYIAYRGPLNFNLEEHGGIGLDIQKILKKGSAKKILKKNIPHLNTVGTLLGLGTVNEINNR